MNPFAFFTPNTTLTPFSKKFSFAGVLSLLKDDLTEDVIVSPHVALTSKPFAKGPFKSYRLTPLQTDQRKRRLILIDFFYGLSDTETLISDIAESLNFEGEIFYHIRSFLRPLSSQALQDNSSRFWNDLVPRLHKNADYLSLENLLSFPTLWDMEVVSLLDPLLWPGEELIWTLALKRAQIHFPSSSFWPELELPFHPEFKLEMGTYQDRDNDKIENEELEKLQLLLEQCSPWDPDLYHYFKYLLKRDDFA